MDKEPSDWIAVFTLLFVFLYFTYFGWINKTSRHIRAMAKADPYYPGYRYVYRCRAFSIILGVIVFGFIIALLVTGGPK